ncbi:MAG TPA: FtsX-like permease family protein [Saprospiraceae bacterium]|nr:FtsX-like permease family protein [Saprospiraceae bacterium]
MFKNNLIVSLRNLVRNRLYAILNLAGLTVGFAGFLLIGLYVIDELQFDRMHAKADRIYRVVEERTSPEGREVKTAASSYNLAARSKSDIAEVEEFVKMTVFGRANVYEKDIKTAIYEPMWLCDASFGKVFDFKWLQGDAITALDKPNNVVMTRATARRVYGTEYALGKTVIVDQFEDPMTVTGIIEDFPKNSHLDVPYLVSMATLDGRRFYEGLKASDWTSNYFTTYLMLRPDASPVVATEKLNSLIGENLPDDFTATLHFNLLALPDIHFQGAGIEGIGDRVANPSYVWIFSLVGFFLLAIACINYINLSTARAASRTKEVGVRKVVGADRWQLARQFLIETYMLTLAAGVLAVAVLQFILPVFNTFADKTLTLNVNSSPTLWAAVAGSALMTALFAGMYPAFYLSRMKPVVLFRNVFIGGRWEVSMRKVLVVTQFALSALMMIASAVVWQQMKYLNTKDLGFDRDQLLVVDINSGDVRRGYETIKNGFSQIPSVQHVSVTSRVPGEWKVIPRVAVQIEGRGDASSLAWFIGADADFLSTYQVPLLEGRNFLEGSIADSASVLINETTLHVLNIQDPVGKWIEIPSVAYIGDQEQMEAPFHALIIGVIKDFHFQTLREKIAPLIVAAWNNPVQSIDYFTVRMTTDNVQNTLAQLEGVMHKTDPGHLFESHFLDDQWALFYEEDVRREKIVTASALIAMIIACLGLFGLATFTVDQKAKEIGVRKVLGASTAGIVGLLSKDFLKLVVVALLIASPLAWIFMHKWLDDFAYRIDIEWWVFVLAGVVAVATAFLTVSFQSIKAALSNPVISLRSE